MKTATGNYPLGWRRRKYAWEQDLDGMIAWALDNELEVIDLGRTPTAVPKRWLMPVCAWAALI